MAKIHKHIVGSVVIAIVSVLSGVQMVDASQSPSFIMSDGNITWYETTQASTSFVISPVPPTSSSSSSASSSSIGDNGGSSGGSGGGGGSGQNPNDVKPPSSGRPAAPDDVADGPSSSSSSSVSSSIIVDQGPDPENDDRTPIDFDIVLEPEVQDRVRKRPSVGIPVPRQEKAIDRTSFFHHVEPHGVAPEREVLPAYVSTHTYQVGWHIDFYLMILVVLLILAIELAVSALIYQEFKDVRRERADSATSSKRMKKRVSSGSTGRSSKRSTGS